MDIDMESINRMYRGVDHLLGHGFITEGESVAMVRAISNEHRGFHDDIDDTSMTVRKIVFNFPATIVFWADGTKTVVKTARGELFDMYHGFTAAVAKKVYGNNTRVKKTVHKFEDSYRKNLKKKMENQMCCCFPEDLIDSRHSGRYPWGSTSNEGADENE